MSFHGQSIQVLLNWLLPPLCPATGEMVDSHGIVAPEYWKSLSFISAPHCDCCGIPFDFSFEEIEVGDMLCAQCIEKRPLTHQLRSAIRYDDHSKDLILRYKHADQLQAARIFIPWLHKAGAGFWTDADMLIPVPLHYFRLLRRRYNQAAILAKGLSKSTAITYRPDILVRTKATQSQGHLSSRKRRENLKNAFVVDDSLKPDIEGKTIVLIDDVATSGATLDECAKTLYAAGAKKVNALTIARVVKTT